MADVSLQLFQFGSDSGDLPESIAYPYNLEFFRDIEFKCCTPSCSIMDMNPQFMYLLDRLRKFLGKPIVLNSAYRSLEYELNRGRSGRSAHCKGLAVDIRCPDSKYRLDLLCCLFSPGFDICRIGIGENFIHLDVDKSLPPGVWTYHDKNFEEIL